MTISLSESTGRVVSQMVPLADLQAHPRNYNRHPQEQVERIAESLRKFGQPRAIVAWRRFILVGHGVVEAARLLRWEAIRADVLPDDYPEHLALGYLVADNELAKQSDPDEAALAALLDEARQLDEELLLAMGFDEGEFDALLKGLEDEVDLGDDTEPELERAEALRELWGIEEGHLWQMGDHRLICGDAEEEATVARLLDGESPILMVTDPPYGVEYDPSWRAEAGINKSQGKMGAVTNDGRFDWRDAYALFPGDVAYVWHAGRFTAEVKESLVACEFEIVAQIIWAKDRFALSRGDYHWQHEPCWYAVRRGCTHNWQGARDQSTVWQIARADDGGHGHGTQKPLEAMARPIRNNSRVGDGVYDPFAGSGTTIVACEELKRRAFAVELSPAYVAVALQRWADHTGREPRLLS